MKKKAIVIISVIGTILACQAAPAKTDRPLGKAIKIGLQVDLSSDADPKTISMNPTVVTLDGTNAKIELGDSKNNTTINFMPTLIKHSSPQLIKLDMRLTSNRNGDELSQDSTFFALDGKEPCVLALQGKSLKQKLNLKIHASVVKDKAPTSSKSNSK